MLKRVTLLRNYGEFQVGTDAEFADVEGNDLADDLIKRGIAKLAKVQKVYGHIDDMPARLQQQAVELLAIADAAGGFRQQEARAHALAPYRK